MPKGKGIRQRSRSRQRSSSTQGTKGRSRSRTRSRSGGRNAMTRSPKPKRRASDSLSPGKGRQPSTRRRNVIRNKVLQDVVDDDTPGDSDFDTDPLGDTDTALCDRTGHDRSGLVHRKWWPYLQNFIAALVVTLSVVAYFRLERTSTKSGRVLGLLTTLLLAATPITHLLGGLRKHHDAWGVFMPFLGGFQFVLLQALAWLLFGASLFTSISHGLGWLTVHIPSDGLIAIAFACGMLSEFLMVLSLFKFNPDRGSLTRGVSAALVLALLSFGLLVAWEATSKHDASTVLGALGLLAIGVAVPLTHQVEGTRRFQEHWHFYQPLRGGRRFVVLQAVSWFLFGVTMFFAALWIYYIVTTSHIPTPGVIVTLGAGGLLSEFLMLYSLSYFEPPDATVAEHVRRRAIEAHRKGNSVLYDFDIVAQTAFQQVSDFICVCLWYNLHIFPLALWFGCAFGLPFETAALVLGFMFVPYSLTYVTRAHIEGGRAWPQFTDFFRFSFDAMMRYFDTRVIAETKLSSRNQYVFGFHPHGIYPLTVMYLTHSTTWRRMFGHIRPLIPLGAGVFFKGPWMRDIAMWLGGRSVSRESFSTALAQGNNVIMVPGGMAEMRFSHSGDHVEIVGHHSGFIRMAMKAGASLVPVYSFGEHKILDNVRMPSVQAFFEKKIGFPMPFFPYGLLGLPLPRQKPVRVVIGKPIRLPQTDTPTQAQVESIRVKYFAALQALHDRHKADCDYPQQTMTIVHRRRKNTLLHSVSHNPTESK